MSTLNDAISRFFANASDPVLFSGAGVSAHAGVLIWAGLLDRLKEWIRIQDALTANQMAELLHEQNFITAADYFFLSPRANAGDKLKALEKHLDAKDFKQLVPLVRLPFNGFITTNFDRGLLDAYAAGYGKSARDFRRGDDSFKEVSWCTQPYVARIHGGVESPTSIVLASKHFEEVGNDEIYKDFLVNLFTRKNVLFLGCSFTDPAVRAVFDYINKLYGPTPPGRHMAFVQNDVENEFITRLHRMNVEVIRYDPKENHKQLWDEIDAFSTQANIPAPANSVSPTIKETLPFKAAKQYLASCYARLKLSGRIQPLREAVVEGIVSSVIQSHAPKGLTVKLLNETVHHELGIPPKDASALVEASLKRLTEEKLCRIHKDNGSRKVAWIGAVEDTNKLDQAIDVLVKSVVDRVIVQEGLRPVHDLHQALNTFLRDLVLQRGWDLGAAFATNKPLEDVDISKLLFNSCAFLSLSEIDKLTRVCIQLIAAPTEAEAVVLAELGRASFALELAIHCPRNLLFHTTVLPQKVYLDANVLMPALTHGHPYHEIYLQTINRLRQAVTLAAGNVQVIAYKGFLNEIVSHRKLAIQEIEDWGGCYREGIVREAILYGTSNMNVFVGAYANVAQSEKDLDFVEFLNKYAPYTTEKELTDWLRHHGILVQSDNQMRTGEYSGISFELQKAYASALENGKDIRLLEHDAVQLSSLFSDQQKGIRSILVTADKRLREMLTKGKYIHLSEYMISNVGLTQMIDLLVGSSGDSRAITGLIWSAKSSSKTEEVRQYLVTLALREYDEAMAMEMPHVVERIAEDIVAEATRAGLNLDSENATDRRKFLQLAGGFEDKFFDAIRERIELREKQSNGS